MRPSDMRRERLDHAALGGAVEVRCRLVEQQQRRVPHERAGEGQSLALARREPTAALAEHRVNAVRQRPHDLEQTGGLERLQ